MELFLHYLSMPYLLQGIEVTLQVTAPGLIGGLIMGMLLAAMQLSRFPLLAAMARGYSVIFRGTPKNGELTIFRMVAVSAGSFWIVCANCSMAFDQTSIASKLMPL